MITRTDNGRWLARPEWYKLASDNFPTFATRQDAANWLYEHFGI